MTMRRLLIGAALVCALLGAALIWQGLSRPWQPQAGFDVLGILWLLMNLPNIAMIVTGGLLEIGAIAMLVYAIRARVREANESARLLADPRFHGLLSRHARQPEAPGQAPPDTAGPDR